MEKKNLGIIPKALDAAFSLYKINASFPLYERALEDRQRTVLSVL
jgi:hypothetical protein